MIERSQVRVPAGAAGFFSSKGLCWLLFRHPFHPRCTAVARERFRWVCRKCRRQVAANTHASYLCSFQHSDTVSWRWFTQNLRRGSSSFTCGSSFTWHQPCNNQTARLNIHRSGYSAVWFYMAGWWCRCHVKLLPSRRIRLERRRREKRYSCNRSLSLKSSRIRYGLAYAICRK